MFTRALISKSTNSRFFRSLGSIPIKRSSLLDLTLGHQLRPAIRPFSSRVTSDIKLPIGYDNFREVIENRLDFVDKSLFIRDMIDDRATKAAVVTRPRRFGKTLNLSMLHHFLAGHVNGQSTRGLFDGLKITEEGDKYLQHQGKYPVIFISLKDIKSQTYKDAYEAFRDLMSDVYAEHRYLLSSPKLYDEDKDFYKDILRQRANTVSVRASLKNLTKYLYSHYGTKPWLLIDEYDTPIQSSYVHGYYSEMIEFMRIVFGSVLKTNPYLYRAVITGILRIAKESLFSGVNNLEVYSLLRSEYGEYFGFTHAELEQLLVKSNLESQLEEIENWYNGYQSGDIVVYNPWSVVNCIKRKGALEPYWINTSDNQLIKDILIHSRSKFKEDFELLLQDKPVEHLIDENTVFGDLSKNESAAWSLLLMAGYLKVISQERTDDGLRCTLAIPNKEVRDLYKQIIKEWLSNGHGIEWYNEFLEHLLSGNIEMFKRELKDVMEQTISVHDTGRDPEAFYHGFMIGLTASLYYRKNYELQSNRESGYGRYDYMIFSHDKSKPTLLLEFKKVDAVKDLEKLEINLQEAARQALGQITQKRYLAEVEKRGSTNILKIGLAFCGKRFGIEYEHIDKVLKKEGLEASNEELTLCRETTITTP